MNAFDLKEWAWDRQRRKTKNYIKPNEWERVRISKKLRKKTTHTSTAMRKNSVAFFCLPFPCHWKIFFTMFTIRPHSIPASLLKFDAVSRICVCTHDNNKKKNQQDVKQRAKNHKSKSDQPKRNWATKKKEKSPPRCGKFNYREKQPFLKLRMSCKYFLVNIFLFSSHSFSALVHTFMKYAKI